MTEHHKPKMRAAEAWLKKLEASSLSTQEKIDATKVLLRL